MRLMCRTHARKGAVRLGGKPPIGWGRIAFVGPDRGVVGQKPVQRGLMSLLRLFCTEDLKVHVPVLFIAGSRDGVIAGATADELVESMTPEVQDLREVVLIPGISHWVQQEASDETNAAMLDFLTEL